MPQPPDSPPAQPLSTSGLVMPPDFPTALYEGIRSQVAGREMKDARTLFDGAWKAISYRFLAVCDYAYELSSSIAKHGGGPPHLERYRQEKALFGMFSNGFSVFESTFFALYTLGFVKESAFFPIATEQDRRWITPVKTRDTLLKAFPSDPIGQSVQSFLGNAIYKKWAEIRHTLNHRTAPGRIIHGSVGVDIDTPDIWKIRDISLGPSMGPEHRAELAASLAGLLQHIDEFAKEL